MRHQNIVLIGVLALGIGAINSPATSAVRAEHSHNRSILRRFVPHPTDSLHYTSGILTFAQGDVDGDRDIDIVGADFYDASNLGSKLWLNDGTGVFTEPIALPAFVNNATDVELVDLDGDEDLDLIVARTEELPELVAFNNGHGVFDRVREFDTGFTFHIIAADFDGDDDPDILTINEPDPDPFDPHPTDARERLWLNDGTGVLTETARFEVGAWAAAHPADIDGDHDLDLVVSHTHTTIWLNDGAAHFAAAHQFPAEQGTVQAVGDVDGDGDIDTLGVPGDGAAISVGRNTGTGTFSFEQERVAGLHAGVMQLADIDHDTDLDILCSGGWNEPFTVLSNDSHGHFTSAQVFGGATVSRVVVADVNNDTWLDVVAGHNPHVSQDPSAPSVWLNDPAPIRGTVYLPIIAQR